MSWLQEFKTFALKGNMVDLAIGVIIGTAFSKVVSSLVSDIIMPPIGMFLGGVDFSALSLKLHFPGYYAPPVEIKYGLFINTLIDFFILTAIIFMVVKGMNKMRLASSDVLISRSCPECLMTIPLKAKKCAHCGSTLESH